MDGDLGVREVLEGQVLFSQLGALHSDVVRVGIFLNGWLLPNLQLNVFILVWVASIGQKVILRMKSNNVSHRPHLTSFWFLLLAFKLIIELDAKDIHTTVDQLGEKLFSPHAEMSDPRRLWVNYESAIVLGELLWDSSTDTSQVNTRIVFILCVVLGLIFQVYLQ